MVVVVQFFTVYLLSLWVSAYAYISTPLLTWLSQHAAVVSQKENQCISVSSTLECTDHLTFRPTGLSAQLMHVTVVT